MLVLQAVEVLIAALFEISATGNVLWTIYFQYTRFNSQVPLMLNA